MSELKQYHLHAFKHAQLHFEVYDAREYLKTRIDKASRPHRHSYYQLIWFKSAGRHHIDYEVVEHPAQTCFMINKSQVHHFCRDSPNEAFLFHFNDIFIAQHDPDLLERWSLSVFSEMLTPYTSLDQQEVHSMQALTDLIRAEVREQGEFYRETTFHLFATLLTRLERKLDLQRSNQAPGEAFVLAARFKKLVMEHIHEFHGVDELAEQLHTNARALTKATKAILLQTPARIITDLKVLEAKRMLSNPALSVKEVGYKLGFEQATYFTKYFKKATGITPKEFQQSLQ